MEVGVDDVGEEGGQQEHRRDDQGNRVEDKHKILKIKIYFVPPEMSFLALLWRFSSLVAAHAEGVALLEQGGHAASSTPSTHPAPWQGHQAE